MADKLPTFFLNRRSFFRYSTLGAGFSALARLQPSPALASAPPGRLQVLSPYRAEILERIVERMVFTGDDDMPEASETDAIWTIDQSLLQVDESVRAQLRWLLILFELGPLLFQFKPRAFSRMSPGERDAYIRDWASSRFEVRRLAFRALKNLSMLGYYAQDSTWKGIHYDGPWVPRPRRILGAS